MGKRVVVVPYNEQWKTDFEIIKTTGSTSGLLHPYKG